MEVQIEFYSYFKDLTECKQLTLTLPEGSTLGQLHEHLIRHFPALAAMRKSTLMAVGVEYEDSDHVLRGGEKVSLFPPVQGG